MVLRCASNKLPANSEALSSTTNVNQERDNFLSALNRCPATPQLMDEWSTLPWKKIELSVFKPQKRIYQASHRDDVKTVRKLQRLLINSRSAKLLSVRRVTQDKGSENAGIHHSHQISHDSHQTTVAEVQRTRQTTPTSGSGNSDQSSESGEIKP